MTAWRTRPLDAVWPIVYFDGIVVHVRGGNGRVSQHTIYVALGVNLEGHKELLGLWLSENEGAKFWLSCLTDLKNRGLRDIFVACIDGLSGFAEAIHAAYPQTSVQLCIVHLVRAALRYVSSEDSKQVAADLKKIYQAATVVEAEQALEEFAQAWDAEVSDDCQRCGEPSGRTSSRCSIFRAPIRKAIYTTNAIESVNSVIRKFTRNRKIYPNEESALKLIYMAIQRGVQEMDHADPSLETGPEPLRHHVRGPNARLNSANDVPCSDTKICTGPVISPWASVPSFVKFLHQLSPSPFDGFQASFDLPGFLVEVGQLLLELLLVQALCPPFSLTRASTSCRSSRYHGLPCMLSSRNCNLPARMAAMISC